jgi:hypothetical protein
MGGRDNILQGEIGVSGVSGTLQVKRGRKRKIFFLAKNWGNKMCWNLGELRAFICIVVLYEAQCDSVDALSTDTFSRKLG